MHPIFFKLAELQKTHPLSAKIMRQCLANGLSPDDMVDVLVKSAIDPTFVPTPTGQQAADAFKLPIPPPVIPKLAPPNPNTPGRGFAKPMTNPNPNLDLGGAKPSNPRSLVNTVMGKTGLLPTGSTKGIGNPDISPVIDRPDTNNANTRADAAQKLRDARPEIGSLASQSTYYYNKNQDIQSAIDARSGAIKGPGYVTNPNTIKSYDPAKLREAYLAKAKEFGYNPQNSILDASEQARRYLHLANQAGRATQPFQVSSPGDPGSYGMSPEQLQNAMLSHSVATGIKPPTTPSEADEWLKQHPDFRKSVQLPDTMKTETPLDPDSTPLMLAAGVGMPLFTAGTSGMSIPAALARGAMTTTGATVGGYGGGQAGRRLDVNNPERGELIGSVLGGFAGGAAGMKLGPKAVAYGSPLGTNKNPLPRMPSGEPNQPVRFPSGKPPTVMPEEVPNVPGAKLKLPSGEPPVIEPGMPNKPPVDIPGVKGVGEPTASPTGQPQRNLLGRLSDKIKLLAEASKNKDSWAQMSRGRLLGSAVVDPSRPILEGGANLLSRWNPVVGEGFRHLSRAVMAPGRYVSGTGFGGAAYNAAFGSGNVASKVKPFIHLGATGLAMSQLYPSDNNKPGVQPIMPLDVFRDLGNYDTYYTKDPTKLINNTLDPYQRVPEATEKFSPVINEILTQHPPSEWPGKGRDWAKEQYQAGQQGRPESIFERADNENKALQAIQSANQPVNTVDPNVDPTVEPTIAPVDQPNATEPTIASPEPPNAIERAIRRNEYYQRNRPLIGPEYKQVGATEATPVNPTATQPVAPQTPTTQLDVPTIANTVQSKLQQFEKLRVNGQLPPEQQQEYLKFSVVHKQMGDALQNVNNMKQQLGIQNDADFIKALKDPNSQLYQQAQLKAFHDPVIKDWLAKQGVDVNTREGYNAAMNAHVGIWEALPDWSKGLFIGGLGLSAIGILSSLFGNKDEEGDSSIFSPIAAIGGLGAAAYGLSGGQPSRYLNPTFRQDLWNTVKQPFANFNFGK